MNFESTSAVAFIGIFLCAIPNAQHTGRVKEQRARRGVLLPLLAVLPLLITIQSPFLFDSYTHIVTASKESFRDVIHTAYVHPTSGDFFFRPLGYIDYWLESKWAGFSQLRWHIDGLLFHLVAIYLILILCRRLGLSIWASSVAALLFGIHGANPEAVSWVAARFDELATVFVLLALILLCEYADKQKKNTLFLMLASCVCSVLSKESAFCIPGLALCCLWFRGRVNKAGIKGVVSLVLACAAVFVYRCWVVGGIGGYRDSTGTPSILHFSVARFVETVLFRMWGVLLFPINWSVRPEMWLVLAMIFFVFATVVAAHSSGPTPRRAPAALIFCVIALLPAAHLASLDARITGARVFHLATVGLALLIGAVYDGFANKHLATFVITGFLLFQCAALVHNLAIWRDTAYLAWRTCSAFAKFSSDTQPLWVLPLPSTHNGVFFLANGFGDCVYVNSGKRVAISSPGTNHGKKDIFEWDEDSESIKKLSSR